MAIAYSEKRDFGNAGSDIAAKTQQAASETTGKVKDMASTVSQKVGEAASFVGKKAEDASSAMGASMKSLGGTIRENAPHTGMAGSASSALADSLEASGRYLQDHGLSGIGADLTTLIRRNPIPAILIGVGTGFLLARAVSRR